MVIVAKYAGFCFGVRRAVSICESAAETHGECLTLGPIIHNKHVIRDLEEKGVRTAYDISEVTPESTVIIRSHGAGRDDHEKLEALGAKIVDATCPDVKRIHDIVCEEERNGRLPIIVGDRLHPEVRAIAGWCGECEVFETAEEFVTWLADGENAKKPMSFVFQTTNKKIIFNTFAEIIKKECTNYNIFDTICKATLKRQQETEEISKIADVMVVVGDRNSANSLRLTDICKEHCRRVFFVESAKELEGADIRLSDAVGITAGASTPAWIIKEVTQKMSEELKLDETVVGLETHEDVPAAAPEIETQSDQRKSDFDESSEAACDEREAAEEATDVVKVEPEEINDEELTINDNATAFAEEPEAVGAESEVVKAETEVDTEYATVDAEETATVDTETYSGEILDEDAQADAAASQETFEEMLEKSIKTLHTGQKVTGIVTSITSTEVSVDLGAKQSGYIPISEFLDDSDSRIEDVVKIGDTIESFVMRVNDVEGMIMLSKKRLDAIKNWDEIEAARESRTTVEGFVTEENKGGIVVNVKGVRVFVPASQTGLPKSAPMSELVKKTVKLRVTEVNQSRRRVVGSIRAVQSEERRERSNKLWEDIEVGKQYDGVVKSMTSYGVFVDIGGVDGMIHISELSWTRIKQPSEVMSVGDEVSVYVLSFDKENRKISLGYKKNEDNPWTKFTTQYAVGDVTNVKIVKMMPFGAFAEICPGVDGLIHISQITDHRIGLPSEVLSDGQMVDVKITEIDFDRKKISLSIRALLDSSSQPISDREAFDARDMDNTPVVVYDTDAPPPPEPDDDLSDDEQP